MSKNFDNSNVEKVVSQLQEMGLSAKEAFVYMALLPRRDIGTSKLIQMTGLHGQFVYNALERLEKLGLAKHVIQSGRRKFSANAPSRLLSLIEEKRMTAHSLARQLQSRYSGAHEQDFEVFQGEAALLAHEMESMRNCPEGSRIDVIGGGKDRYWTIFEREGYAEEYEYIRKQRNISIRYLSAETSIQDFGKMKKERWGWSHRSMPGLSTGVVTTDIWPDSVHFSMFGDQVLSFAITGKEIVDGYREFFEALWKIAK